MIERPSISDGGEIWKIARDSAVLDLNSSYAYLLWCRDFAGSSAVARVDGQVAGFVTGYLKPTDPRTVVVWQIAVRGTHRGQGLAGALLDHLVGRLSGQDVRYLETTITADNVASLALFRSMAQRWSTDLRSAELFDAAYFPDGHESEDLYRIGPFSKECSERIRVS